MNNLNQYSRYFTKDCLMGPNSFRLLEELLRRNPFDTRFDRTLDLGCGMALTPGYSFLRICETIRKPCFS